MKALIRIITLGTLATASWLLLGVANLYAQNAPPQGNLDPAQMRQRMLQFMRQRLEVSDDAEWKIISERINKVMEARQAMGGSGGPGGPPLQAGGRGPDGFGPPGGDPQSGPGGSPGNSDRAGKSRGGPGGFGRQSSPELDALNKALDSKASADEIKNKLAEWRAAQKKKESTLTQAQDALRTLLSVRQEAIAVTLGLLN